MSRKEESILYSTGQIWKYRVMSLGVVIAVALVFGAQWFKESLSGSWYLGLTMAGMVVSLSSLAFPLVSVVCPKCGARWGWLAANRKRGTKGYRWVARLTLCPVCETSEFERK